MGLTCTKKSICKKLINLAYLWSRAWLANKNKYCSLPTIPPNGWKFDSCFYVSTKGQKRDKSKFVTISVRIVLMIILW